MTNKLFGVADPDYDARRVRSSQSISPDLGGGSPPIGGSGLENKIYLWHADGSAIDVFDPNQAGLVAALAGAAAGDTVWLPSIPIACTAAITIPASVALVGLSHKSILSFSGFAGAAIVLSAGSIIDSFTLNHSDGKWFDASADGSKALRIHGTAKRAIIGTAVPAEPWLATNNDLFWLDRAINGWHKITPGLGTIDNFYIRADGSMAFVYIHLTGWYKGTALKTSPVWTSIAAESGGSNFRRHGSCDGTDFYMVEVVDYPTRVWKHGTYNGTSWSYGSDYTINWLSPDCTAKDFACYWDQVFIPNGTRIEFSVTDYRDSTDGWVNNAGTRYAWALNVSNHISLHTPAGSDLVDAGAGIANNLAACFVRGAIGGNHIYAIDHNGILHYSANGSSFSSVATWSPGIANDTIQAGGGDLVWIPQSISSSAVPARLYAVSGWGSTDLTYNFWSLTSGTQTVVGMGMVY